MTVFVECMSLSKYVSKISCSRVTVTWPLASAVQHYEYFFISKCVARVLNEKAYFSCNLDTWEVDTGKSEVQCHPWLLGQPGLNEEDQDQVNMVY